MKVLLSQISEYFQTLRLQVALASTMVVVEFKGFFTKIYTEMRKACKYAYFKAGDFTFRMAGAACKLPVYLLNNAAILGNILQMRANNFKAKAKAQYIPLDDK